MSSTQANTDPSLVPASSNTNGPSSSSPTSQTGSHLPATSADGTPLPVGLDSSQIINLLRHLPNVLKYTDPSQQKEAAAEILSNLSQQSSFPPGAGAPPPHNQHPLAHQMHNPFHHSSQNSQHMSTEPGPSSHPRGPPNLGQLSALAASQSAAAPMSATRTEMQHDGGNLSGDEDSRMNGPGSPTSTPNASGRTRGKSATMSQDEWTRQRKDNHKEVERRRRGNINEGINELGRIVPNGTGEKAKGAILSRAVQYIHHLKENEARNIEKWTLEKLLMDQAMGDLQAQLEEMRRMWEEERVARQRLESELEVVRGVQGGRSAARKDASRSRSPDGDKDVGGKRRSRDENEVEESGENDGEGDRDGKRQRVD
ncbi:hypothetical protein JAAARDRAFT_36714 [Jaapia argillacea MUCL 33604]|uniref:BHLH domain-containing protein n=1 Tax=Jaapia argillacea MUCL 33604 TaxID=933084 RepID=A0A067PMA8_9AGAM|nr:hypothetical protein JAAARDRAFT_36714 [Jaapia argillacea MUCL 33604]